MALPVIGAALVIAGGTVASPQAGAERVLALRPMGALGRISYSLYLWHWPILIIATQHSTTGTLSTLEDAEWIVVALVLAMVTYRVLENPIRLSPVLRRKRWAGIVLALGMIVVTLVVVTLPTRLSAPVHTADTSPNRPLSLAPTAREVARTVAAAPSIRTLPGDLDPPLTRLSIGFPPAPCVPSYSQDTVPLCSFGDPRGARTMVLYGDSHAGMWFQALDEVATQMHWRLYYLGKGACPVADLRFVDPPGAGASGAPFTACTRWHQFATARINRIRPDLVVVSEASDIRNGQTFTAQQWGSGLRSSLTAIRGTSTRLVVLGNVPRLPKSPTTCLSRNAGHIQACSSTRAAAIPPFEGVERQVVESLGGRYINTTPWFCSKTCTAVIGNYAVYSDQFHIAAPYAQYLEGVLARSVDLTSNNR